MTRGGIGRRLDDLERRADAAAPSPTPTVIEDFIILAHALEPVQERWRAASARLSMDRGDLPNPEELVGEPGSGYCDALTGAWVCDERELQLVRLWHRPDTELRARQLLGLRDGEDTA
jgi:hypothetical protein